MIALRPFLLFVGIGASLCAPVIEDKGAFKTISPLPRECNYDDIIDDDLLIEFGKSNSNDKNSQNKLSPMTQRPGTFDKNYDRNKIVEKINAWTPEDGTNVWELSGLFEGDMLLHPNDLEKHGVLNESLRWQHGIVPYYIREQDFTKNELKVINDGIDELRKKTCLLFRHRKKSDKDYIVVQATDVGCWSSVGRRGESQVLNLMTPGCVKHGVVIHEFVHALGFYHQQSSYDRDKYVTIHWDNIIEEHKHNFKKYDRDTVSNYDVGYDYGSLMHYGPRAFARNKNLVTITPKMENVTIGQRDGLSKKDIEKLKIMYEDECHTRDILENIID